MCRSNYATCPSTDQFPFGVVIVEGSGSILVCSMWLGGTIYCSWPGRDVTNCRVIAGQGVLRSLRIVYLFETLPLACPFVQDFLRFLSFSYALHPDKSLRFARDNETLYPEEVCGKRFESTGPSLFLRIAVKLSRLHECSSSQSIRQV